MKNHSNRSISLDDKVWEKIDKICQKTIGAKCSTAINDILIKHFKIKVKGGNRK